MSILWIGAIDGVGFKNKGVLVKWSGIPTAVSLYLVCYTAHHVFPTIYNSMKNKKHFSKILSISFALSSIIYAVVAIFGYLMYGEESAVIAISTTIVSPLTKYALILSPIMEAINTRLIQANYKRRSLRMLTGTGLISKGYRRCLEFESVVLVVIIVMGLVLMVTGTYSAIVGITLHL
ncbi:unnamed protein product [Arabidopsis thaliana]|uniref:Amino acid transporter transmembrane domain-containing protein n=1 Tax=Arabidopsis thaliana TaxID=3702 RepID=A0A654EHJ0_ARATH|nr:unnamed protein product [Arabidopsis thaliana]